MYTMNIHMHIYTYMYYIQKHTLIVDDGRLPKCIPIVEPHLPPRRNILRDLKRQEGVQHAGGVQSCGVLALPHGDVVFIPCA